MRITLALFFDIAFRRPDACLQIQIIRLLESIAETQTQLQPALLR
jgi:hypothetical protein